MSVIKRDGRVEDFNADKIVNAARKAYEVCNSTLSENIEKELRNLLERIFRENCLTALLFVLTTKLRDHNSMTLVQTRKV